MLELLNSLSWPATFAIVASVVSIITGLLGYLISARRKAAISVSVTDPLKEGYDHEKLHTRINDAVERVAAIEGDIKELRAFVRVCQKQLSDHEQRDIDDFKILDAKIDRLMDIIVRMLQDDKL